MIDLEKARAVDIDLLAATDWGELRARYRAALAEIERLRAELASANVELMAAGETVRAKDARIQELEDALVEERARAKWLVGDDPCDPPTLDWRNEPNDIPESVRLLWGKSARTQIQAEGKIGPDAKPRSWQITEERVGLLRYCLDSLLDAPDIEESPGPRHSIEMLRAMLREAE